MSTRPEVLGRRSLLGLPVNEWARRMRQGVVRLRGQIEASTLEVGGLPLELAEGPLELHATFLGGAAPTLEELVVDAAVVVHGGVSPIVGERLVLREQRIFVEARQVPASAERVGSGRLLTDLVRRLGDVEVSVRAEPDGDVVLRLGGGVEVRVASHVRLTLDGAAEGPADDLRLCRPVEIGFGGDGIRLHHGKLEWLSRLASVRVAHATLHPDGSVDLEGGANPGFDAAVKGGLHTASASLSALVRRSPGVRRFLHVGRWDL